MRVSTFALAVVLLAACTKPATPPATEPEPEPAGEDKPADEGKPAVDSGTEERPKITAADCEAQGGKVIGDIGDGAIHQPEYRCPASGEAPIGSIVADEGGPVGVEGAVCCK